MSHRARSGIAGLASLILMTLVAGCGNAMYRSVVRPTPDVKALDPTPAKFTDEKIETLLKANPRPAFPCALAVARLTRREAYDGGYHYRDRGETQNLELIKGDEADAWRKLLTEPANGRGSLISQVQFIGPMLLTGEPTMEKLRNAAARLHAPLLLVYTQDNDRRDGYNDASMLYWTIVGLFVVPGNTVGHYSACEALLVDTRTGLLHATAQGDCKKEENVLPGAVSLARTCTEAQARAEAVSKLQADVQNAVNGVAMAAVLDKK